MSNIKKITAYQILDSRGIPTLAGKLHLEDGRVVESSVPSGTSVGKNEAHELRDDDPAHFNGLGVSQAVNLVNIHIGPKLIGVSPLKQLEIETWLLKADGTTDKSKLGANTTLLISQLITKASSFIKNVSIFTYINDLCREIYKTDIKLEKIPTPIFNLINGGLHGSNNLEFQEFQIVPSSSLKYSQMLETGTAVFHQLKKTLQYRNANVSVGTEGGYTPNFPRNIDALEVLNEAIVRSDLKPGLDIFIGLDLASSNFFKGGKYNIKDNSHPLNPREFLDLIISITKNYPILTLEDPLDEEDWEGWKKLQEVISKEIYLIGDDLICTNKERLTRAIREKAVSALLVKPNQIGTITQTLEVVCLARKNNINYVVSHRSGETNDSFIADFAVGVQSDFVKFGAPSRGERVAKYNRLLEIEREEFANTK